MHEHKLTHTNTYTRAYWGKTNIVLAMFLAAGSKNDFDFWLLQNKCDHFKTKWQHQSVFGVCVCGVCLCV